MGTSTLQGWGLDRLADPPILMSDQPHLPSWRVREIHCPSGTTGRPHNYRPHSKFKDSVAGSPSMDTATRYRVGYRVGYSAALVVLLLAVASCTQYWVGILGPQRAAARGLVNLTALDLSGTDFLGHVDNCHHV
jgi:hypothetical protein